MSRTTTGLTPGPDANEYELVDEARELLAAAESMAASLSISIPDVHGGKAVEGLRRLIKAAQVMCDRACEQMLSEA